MSLLSLIKLEVFLCVFDSFGFERCLYVVFLLQEKLSVHQDLVSQIIMHLVVKVRRLIQVSFSLVIFCILFAFFGLCNLFLLDVYNQIVLFGFFHVYVEINFGKLIGLLFAVVSRSIQMICQSLL